jgi:TolB-like protein/Tfp pilus assembly protein PilF
MNFIAELKRRNVIRMAGLYLVGAWLVVQVSSTVLPMFDAPAWLPRSIVILLAVGFVPTLIFSWVFELTPEGLKRDDEVTAKESIAPQTARRMDRAIIAILALALLYLGFDKFVLTPRREAAMLASASQPAATAGTDKSIAVLPLTNESGDKDQQYFSDGLSENLIVALSQFSGLKVIGRNSAFQFRDSKDDSRTIGAKLGVATLLEGSVQRAGDAVRISAELIRAADGSTLWSERYDRPYKDLFALQDEITRSVAEALKAKLLANGAAAVQTDRPPSGNLDAYSAYLQGKFYFARNSEADLRKAIEQYATATRLDPRYALAWAASSHAGNWLAGAFLSGAEAQQVDAQARQAANTALMLEPNLAAAHSALGELMSAVDFDWNGAETEFRRALQLAPNNNEAMENLGILLAERGSPEHAIELTRRSLATDPLRTTGYLLLCRYLASLGHLDEAEQAIRKAIELQPASGIFNATLVEIEVQRGDAKAALEVATGTLPGIWQDYALAMARQIGNDRAAADAALKLTIDKHADGMAFQIAEVYALRRDPDQTFAWLDRAWVNRDSGLQFLLVNRFILRYQGDPRFAAFCKKIGLPSMTTAKALP